MSKPAFPDRLSRSFHIPHYHPETKHAGNYRTLEAAYILVLILFQVSRIDLVLYPHFLHFWHGQNMQD